MLNKIILKNLYLIALAITTIIYNTNLSAQAAGAPDSNAMPFTLSPEDIEALKAGGADSPMGPITDKDIEEFVSFINNLSEEDMKALEGLATEAAKEIEEAAKKEAESKPPTTTEIKPEEPVVKKEEKNKIPTSKVEQAREILSSTIKYINDLKQEASKDESVSRRLNPWTKDLNDLVYYLNIISSNNVLIGHMLSSEFLSFYENLKKLNKSLEDNIKSFSVEDIIGGNEQEEEDPYEILGVEHDATDKDLEEAFNNIKKLKDPKVLETKLKSQNVDEKEIKRKIKEAKLSFNLVESAYESLKNSKSRAQIDKDIKAKQSSGLSKKEISKRAFSKILDSFGTAFYDNKILQDFVNLLKKYDPIALETKKNLDKAEAEAKKAKEAALKKTVSKSSGGYYDSSNISFGSGGSDSYGSGIYNSNSYPDFSDYGRSGYDSGGWGQQDGLKDKSLGGGGGSKGASTGQEKDESKSQDKNKKNEPKQPNIFDQTEKTPEKKAVDPIKLMQEINANLNIVGIQLENDPRIVKMLSITHEVPPVPSNKKEVAVKRAMPLNSIREAGIVKWAGSKTDLNEHQDDLNYLDSWQKSIQLEKIIEKTNTLKNLVKNIVDSGDKNLSLNINKDLEKLNISPEESKEPKTKKPKVTKKDLAKEFSKGLQDKLSGPVTDLLLTAKNVSGDITSVKNLLKNIEPIHDNLHDIRSMLLQEKDVIEDIKELAKELASIQSASQYAQVLDAEIQGAQENNEAVNPETQKSLDKILKSLEGDRIFLADILKNIDRLAGQIENASSASKQAYNVEFTAENSIASQIEDIDKLVKILQNNKTQDAPIRKTTGIIENINKKLKEIEKNI